VATSASGLPSEFEPADVPPRGSCAGGRASASARLTLFEHINPEEYHTAYRAIKAMLNWFELELSLILVYFHARI